MLEVLLRRKLVSSIGESNGFGETASVFFFLFLSFLLLFFYGRFLVLVKTLSTLHTFPRSVWKSLTTVNSTGCFRTKTMKFFEGTRKMCYVHRGSICFFFFFFFFLVTRMEIEIRVVVG